MTAEGPWRNLRAAMVATVLVALLACAVRSLMGPTGREGSSDLWMATTIAILVLAFWPAGRIIGDAWRMGDHAIIPMCPRCKEWTLQPLVRTQPGRSPRAVGYRCASCKITYRRFGDAVVAEPPVEDQPVDPSGIVFLGEEPRPISREMEIRFLDDDPEPPRANTVR